MTGRGLAAAQASIVLCVPQGALGTPILSRYMEPVGCSARSHSALFGPTRSHSALLVRDRPHSVLLGYVRRWTRKGPSSAPQRASGTENWRPQQSGLRAVTPAVSPQRGAGFADPWVVATASSLFPST